MAVKAIPDGYHSVTPYLVVNGAAKLMDFLKQAFGAREMVRMPGPDGKIGHAELTIGDSPVMMADATTEYSAVHSVLHLYVEDTDATYRQALAAGAVSLMEPADQFYGDRRADVRDPAGNRWSIGTHKEDVSPEEMRRRVEAAMKQRA
ncbi:MAG TPA: VOC family protein [Candidatus Binataceae bacterium]|jgi:uncharacterized glyoxalase superfamily protein PhnB|nr:VOC family protein [Candidatus Binataceae bacterium]